MTGHPWLVPVLSPHGRSAGALPLDAKAGGSLGMSLPSAPKPHGIGRAQALHPVPPADDRFLNRSPRPVGTPSQVPLAWGKGIFDVLVGFQRGVAMGNPRPFPARERPRRRPGQPGQDTRFGPPMTSQSEGGMRHAECPDAATPMSRIVMPRVRGTWPTAIPIPPRPRPQDEPMDPCPGARPHGSEDPFLGLKPSSTARRNWDA